MPPGRALAALALAALAALSNGCSRDEAGPTSTFGQAREAYLDGDYLRGRRLYEAYLKAGPAGQTRTAREEAFSRLALIAGLSGGKARALEVLEAAIADFADDQEKLALYLPELARAQEGERQYAKAAETLARYAELENLSPDQRATGYLREAKNLRRLKKMPQAKEVLARCLELPGQTIQENNCRAELALIAAMENRWNDAAKELEKLAAAENRQSPETLFNLAEAYENLDRKTDAARIYKELLASYPNKPALVARLQ